MDFEELIVAEDWDGFIASGASCSMEVFESCEYSVAVDSPTETFFEKVCDKLADFGGGNSVIGAIVLGLAAAGGVFLTAKAVSAASDHTAEKSRADMAEKLSAAKKRAKEKADELRRSYESATDDWSAQVQS